MKWMDRPNVTEMERGRVYEMERQKKCQKMEMSIANLPYNTTLSFTPDALIHLS